MEDSEFVYSKLAVLTADVELTPLEVNAAWAAVRRRRAKGRSWAGVAGAVAAAVALVVLAIPSTRLWAQSIWNSFVLRHTEVVTLSWATTSPELLLPNVFPLAPYGESWRTNELAEAEQLTGFSVGTLASEWLPYAPAFRVEQPPEIVRTVDLSLMRRELTRLGRPMVEAPPGIDGAKTGLRPQGRMVVSSYGQCPQLVGPWRACAFLVQARPRVLDLPPGLAVAPFVQFSLELAGLPSRQARSLMEAAGTPSMSFLPLESGSTVEKVTVKGAPALLVRYPNSVAFILHWQAGEFHYELFGRNAERAVAMAETMR